MCDVHRALLQDCKRPVTLVVTGRFAVVHTEPGTASDATMADMSPPRHGALQITGP
jgi:hypothetical protein